MSVKSLKEFRELNKGGSVRDRLIAAGLATPEDFDHYAKDLHIRHRPEIEDWLRQHGWSFDRFRVAKGHPDAGQLWIDVPFAA